MLYDIVSGVLAIVMLVAWYQLAKMKNIIGIFLRTIWNFWFKIFSFIPFLGWMSRFVISANEKE